MQKAFCLVIPFAQKKSNGIMVIAETLAGGLYKSFHDYLILSLSLTPALSQGEGDFTSGYRQCKDWCNAFGIPHPGRRRNLDFELNTGSQIRNPK